MTLTPRGRRVVLVTVAAAALLAGATAQHWDPYARELACQHNDPRDHAERLYAPVCREH